MLILCFSFNLIFAKTNKQESSNKNKDIQQLETKDTQQTSKRFFDDRERGWFWYEKQKIDEEEKIKIDNKTASAIPIIKKPEIPWERLYNMPPKEFNKLIDDVRDYAISYPTVENVKDYMRMQNIALERSQKFQNVFSFIAQTDPTLTNEKSYPVSLNRDYLYQGRVNLVNYMADKVKNYGFIYFYSDYCEFCQHEKPIIRKFSADFNADLLMINKDDPKHTNAIMNFGIISVPSIVMVKKDTKEWLLISSGFISYNELQERVYRTIKYMEKERSVEEFANPDYMFNEKGGKSDKFKVIP